MYDGSNRRHIRQAEKRSKLAENNRIAYLRQIMQTLSGRAFMHEWLTDCSMFHEPFSPISPYATAYNCGKQSIGRRLFDDIFTHCPAEYALMMQEAQAKDHADDRRTADELPGRENGRWYTEGSGGYTIDPSGFVHDASSDNPADDSASSNGDTSEDRRY